MTSAGGKIEPETEKNVATEKPQNSLIGSIFENIKTNQSTKKPQEEKVENENEDNDEDGSKMKITKVFDFAGETVE